MNIIQVSDATGVAEIRVVGFDTQDSQNRYFVAAGRNLHVVVGCSSLSQLDALLDTKTSPDLDNRDLLTLTQPVDDNSHYIIRSELSCQGEFLPRNFDSKLENDPILYVDENRYFLGTGETGEYYSIDSLSAGCVYNFANQLFGFEKRSPYLAFGRPEDATQIMDLSCANADHTKYRLSVFKPDPARPLPFGVLVFLGYQDIDSQGGKIDTTLRFHRMNGQLIKFPSHEYDALIGELTVQYKIKPEDIKNTSLVEVSRSADKVFLDYCQGNCAAFQPKIETLAMRPAPRLVALPAAPVVNTLPDVQLDAQQAAEAKLDKLNSYRFMGCDDLLKKIGLAGSSREWFSTVRAQLMGQRQVSGNVFSCPKVAQQVSCEKILDRSFYTVAEFNKVLEDKSRCPVGTTQQVIKLDSNVVVEGVDPIRLGSNVGYSDTRFHALVPSDIRTLTYRFLCTSKDKCLPTSTTDVRTLVISGRKNVVFQGVELKSAINSGSFLADNESSTLKFAGIEISDGAVATLLKTSIKRSEYKGRNLWNMGARVLTTVIDENGFPLNNPERSKLYCLECEIEVENIGVDATDSQVFIFGRGKEANIQGQSIAIALRGSAEALTAKSKVQGDNLSLLGATSRLFIKDSQLRISGNTLVKPVSAFKFLSRGVKQPFTLELQNNGISGLPAEQVSNFRFADYADSDGTAVLQMSLGQFSRYSEDRKQDVPVSEEEVGYFLRCTGKGKLIYKFKNYCI
ncbi:hypothetical protein [Oligoflexus tunisiensis]|uniref:hypothetical protein n=1 Tax=Oligoflexus tunisiensis TaxID=708132 RepID=UPI001C402064|nr:hypothetical protein [Oligoflexus tunisiensis]